MQILREPNDAAIDLEDALQKQHQPQFKPLVGFQGSQTAFLGDQRLITCIGNSNKCVMEELSTCRKIPLSN